MRFPWIRFPWIAPIAIASRSIDGEVLHLASSFNFPNFRKIDRSLDIVGMDTVRRRILEEKNVISNPRVV